MHREQNFSTPNCNANAHFIFSTNDTQLIRQHVALTIRQISSKSMFIVSVNSKLKYGAFTKRAKLPRMNRFPYNISMLKLAAMNRETDVSEKRIGAFFRMGRYLVESWNKKSHCLRKSDYQTIFRVVGKLSKDQ